MKDLFQQLLRRIDQFNLRTNLTQADLKQRPALDTLRLKISNHYHNRALTEADYLRIFDTEIVADFNTIATNLDVDETTYAFIVWGATTTKVTTPLGRAIRELVAEFSEKRDKDIAANAALYAQPAAPLLSAAPSLPATPAADPRLDDLIKRVAGMEKMQEDLRETKQEVEALKVSVAEKEQSLALALPEAQALQQFRQQLSLMGPEQLTQLSSLVTGTENAHLQPLVFIIQAAGVKLPGFEQATEARPDAPKYKPLPAKWTCEPKVALRSENKREVDRGTIRACTSDLRFAAIEYLQGYLKKLQNPDLSKKHSAEYKADAKNAEQAIAYINEFIFYMMVEIAKSWTDMKTDALNPAALVLNPKWNNENKWPRLKAKLEKITLFDKIYSDNFAKLHQNAQAEQKTARQYDGKHIHSVFSQGHYVAKNLEYAKHGQALREGNDIKADPLYTLGKK